MSFIPAILRPLFVLVLLAGTGGFYGCASPSQANIALRKQIQTMEGRIGTLEARHEADQATIRTLEAGATTVPVLPHDRLQALFTAQGLRFGRLTGGADLDPEQPGDEGFKVYVVPTDIAGDPLKAAGSFVVRAFDLSDAEHPLIGEWTFPLEQAAALWYGQGLLYEYILTCPWQGRIPSGNALMLRVEFTDALTQRHLTADRPITLRAAPVTPPARSTEP